MAEDLKTLRTQISRTLTLGRLYNYCLQVVLGCAVVARDLNGRVGCCSSWWSMVDDKVVLGLRAEAIWCFDTRRCGVFFFVCVCYKALRQGFRPSVEYSEAYNFAQAGSYRVRA